MSARSKKPSKKTGKKSRRKVACRAAKMKQPSKVMVDRPFDPAILKQAERITYSYRILLERDNGDWVGSAVEFPNVFGDGSTANECVRNTSEALIGAVAHMLEQGQRPPDASRRTEQVNIRLTRREKLALETAVVREGYRGLSDFVRSAALDSAEAVG